MALNFPDNPTNGEVYVASNGIEYTYAAATDTWTGALGTGSAYWSETDDGSGNIYVTDTNADVYVGGDSDANANVTLTASGAISNTGRILSDGASAYVMVDRDITPGTGALYAGFTQGVQQFKVGTDGIITFKSLNIEDLADLPE